MEMYIHHAIVVTGEGEAIKKAHKRARAIFQKPSNLIASRFSYSTFLIPPDGCREGWHDSVIGDERRSKFKEYLKCSNLEWVEVAYSRDFDHASISAASVRIA